MCRWTKILDDKQFCKLSLMSWNYIGAIHQRLQDTISLAR